MDIFKSHHDEDRDEDHGMYANEVRKSEMWGLIDIFGVTGVYGNEWVDTHS